MSSPDELRAEARELRSKARLYTEQALNLDRKARILELSEGLDGLAVPRTAGRPWVLKVLRDHGWQLDTELAGDLVKYRKEYR